MTSIQREPWHQARKAPFEAFGILYYPVFARRADIEGLAVDDADMAWAMTASSNLEGSGYVLSQQSVLALAAYRHRMAASPRATGPLSLAESCDGLTIDPLRDLRRLAPGVDAVPMYPDFPRQVMAMDEAIFRYHQAMHYSSTYDTELICGLMGLHVEVSEGWLPDVEETPKLRDDQSLVGPKVLQVVLTVEDLRSVMEARLARATRLHPAEAKTALLVFEDLADGSPELAFPRIAFHENMMELMRLAGEGSSELLERVATGLAQHPGDLLKATLYLRDARAGASGKRRLATRQKKGLCRAFEHFPAMSIAQNIADAGRGGRRAPNYLSLERFAGTHLREACRLVASGQVISWASQVERLWKSVEEAQEARAAGAWQALLAQYGSRPGVLLRSLNRLLKGGCPFDLLRTEALAHAACYSLPSLVRTLTLMSEEPSRLRLTRAGYLASRAEESSGVERDGLLVSLLRELVSSRLRELDTPLAGKRIYLDATGISLAGSLLMPNDAGMTGTAWPPVGMAWDLPDDRTVRFFTYWDERSRRVDVDLHFDGVTVAGKLVHIGWDGAFADHGMTTSGDVTTSRDSVEYLDARMGEARRAGMKLVVQWQHIYYGAQNWADIASCYSGALVVKDDAEDVKLYNAENLLFRDDLTGEGSSMAYAVVNFPGHYVRIMRGADLPIGDVGFSLGDYLSALFEAQHATLVETPEEAELSVCVGRSDDASVLSLFDEGFFLG